MLVSEENYSMVLEPEAQFLMEFTKEKKNKMVRIQILTYSKLAWDQTNGSLRAPFFCLG